MYQYNGKELTSEFGLNWNDYDFRKYDPAIGRFTTNDPLIEAYSFQTPYAYAGNDPIAKIDFLGLSAKSTTDDEADESQESNLEDLVNDAWNATPDNGTASFNSSGDCNCGCEGKPPCPEETTDEESWGDWLLRRTITGLLNIVNYANPAFGTGDSNDSFSKKADAVAQSAVISLFFPKGIRGQSLKKIKRKKPKGWKKVPTRDNEGFIFIDENGVERLRYMRPKGNNPMDGNLKWSRENNGYFIIRDANKNLLDKNGKIVIPGTPGWRERSHIMYEGPR